jgi:hypothetical protein
MRLGIGSLSGQIEAAFVRADLAGDPVMPPLADSSLTINRLHNVPAVEEKRDDIAASLRQHLAASLPDYMVPAAFVIMDNFPLTPNGKVDRKTLPAPKLAEAAVVRTIVAPRNDQEKQLVEIWKEVLGVAEIGIDDDFFELGGDSLLSFRITNRANQNGLAVTPRHFFQHRTVAALAAALATDSTSSAAPAPARNTIGRVAREGFKRKVP